MFGPRATTDGSDRESLDEQEPSNGPLEATLISAALPFSLSWLAVGIWTVIALSIGALGATQPARVASRLTIRDTLAYE